MSDWADEWMKEFCEVTGWPGPKPEADHGAQFLRETCISRELVQRRAHYYRIKYGPTEEVRRFDRGSAWALEQLLKS